MAEDDMSVFGFERVLESESLDGNQSDSQDSSSIPESHISTTTKQSNAITAISDMIESKTDITESNREEDEISQFDRNNVLRQL